MSRTRIFAGTAVAAGLLVPALLWGPGLWRAPATTAGSSKGALQPSAPASTPAVPAAAASMAPPAVVASPPPPPPFMQRPADAVATGSLPPAAAQIEAAVSPRAGTQDPVLASLRSYAPDVALAPLAVDQLPLSVDLDAVRAAIALARRGDLAGADAAARALSDPTARLALEWATLRTQPRAAGSARLRAFLTARPHWPSAEWLERQIEAGLFAEKRPAREVRAAFRTRAPQTPLGEMALARAELEASREAQAVARLRKVWREATLTDSLEQALLREFGERLTKADHKARSDRFFYDEKDSASLRAAQMGGPDVVKLAQARASVASARFDKLVAALPKELQADPTLIFARAQAARRGDRIVEAASLLDSAPKTAEALVDGDAWWVERRLVARKLLDQGDAARAYAVAAGHGAASPRATVEAEFHAGWIALRHQDGSIERIRIAKSHFDRAAAVANAPATVARAAYWQGRAAEALGEDRDARAAYAIAGAKLSTYYGQLARARLGLDDARLKQEDPAQGATEFTRVFRVLYAAGERALAMPLAIDAAKTGGRDAELAAVSSWLAERRDAPASLAIGKTALARGAALDETAFPTFGVPAYEAAPNSAEAAIVYAIARQESAFRADAVSHAGAKGLMQMLTSTARETAKRAGLAFDERRLLADPAFNAQLGAAHLGELLAAQQGSYILTFAAYNAGPGRVKQWLAAYGDPRDPQIDPVDWIERIPFSETRDYVQKILENLQVYRVRLGRSDGFAIDADLRRARRSAMLTP